MAKNQYTYITRTIAATPRNKRLTDSIQDAAQTGGGVVGGGGYAGPQYWEMVTAKADGTPLLENEYYLKPVGAPNVVAPGDVIAYAEGIEGLGLPVATYEMFGLFKGKLGGGLLQDENNCWYVDPAYAGGGGGAATNVKWGKVVVGESAELTIDTTTYPLALATHTHKNYLTWKSTMDGYTMPSGYTPITATDTLMGALGKLEAHFGDYVDRVTDQRINGVKTFQQTIYSERDVVAFSEGIDGLGLPTASYDQYGLVRIDNNTIKMDGYGRLYVDGNIGGGASSWDELTGKPTIFPTNWDNVDGKPTAFTPTSHSHDEYVLKSNTGWGTAYQDNTADLSIKGVSKCVALDGYNPLLKEFVHIHPNGTTFLKQGSHMGVKLSGGNGILGYDSTYPEDIGNLYINYHADGLHYTKITKDNDILTSGDVIAYSEGAEGLGLPVASYEQYGLIRIDDVTIKKDSYGRLYAVNTGGGSSGGDYLPLSGGTMTGSITIDGDDSLGVHPSRDNYNSIGSSSYRWYRGYINNFYTKGIHYYGNDSNDYVLLAGGGVKAVSSFGGGSSGTPVPGPRGQGVDYQWSGTSLRLGTIDSNGYTSWGSYVDLQGPQGDPGSSGGGGGGSTSELASEVRIPSNGTHFQRSGTDIGVYMSGGNTINGWHDTNSQNIGNLYFNYYNGNKNVKIDTNCKIYSNGNVVTSDMRLKDKIADVTGVLDSLSSINAFIYTFKSDEDRIMKIGLSAQAVKEVFPQAVTLNYQDNCTEAYYGIDYAQVLTAVAVNGLKELYNKHLSLEQRVAKLEGGAA